MVLVGLVAWLVGSLLLALGVGRAVRSRNRQRPDGGHLRADLDASELADHR